MPITSRLWRQSEKHIYPLLGRICAACVFACVHVRGWFRESVQYMIYVKKKVISSDKVAFNYVFIGGVIPYLYDSFSAWKLCQRRV